jgi:hypothetical protein
MKIRNDIIVLNVYIKVQWTCLILFDVILNEN